MDSILDFNLNDVPDTQIAESGTEATVAITSVKLKHSEKGNLYLSMSCDIQGDDPDADYEPIFYSLLLLPTKSQTTKEANRRIRHLKEWTTCFNVDEQSMQDYIGEAVADIQAEQDAGKFEHAKGLQGDVILKIGQDQHGSDRNEIQRFVVGA